MRRPNKERVRRNLSGRVLIPLTQHENQLAFRPFWIHERNGDAMKRKIPGGIPTSRNAGQFIIPRHSSLSPSNTTEYTNAHAHVSAVPAKIKTTKARVKTIARTTGTPTYQAWK